MVFAIAPDFVAGRRGFLKGTAAAGLVIGFHLPKAGEARAEVAWADGRFAPNAFVRIAPDNSVIIVAKHVEWGMGAHTALAMIIAEELDADWEQVRVEAAPANPELYMNLAFRSQGTGGSTAMRESFGQQRLAGATARAMLVRAAAARWDVPEAEIAVKRGIVTHRDSGRTARFGELAEAASELPVPAEGDVRLKDPARFTLIGVDGVHRLDSSAKIDGTAEFAIDVRLPGMLTAVVARPSRFGATVRNLDAAAAVAVPGVRHVVEVPTGVAVVADSFFAAQRGREALGIDWDETNAERRGTTELLAEYRTLLDQPGAVARRDGNAGSAMATAARTITAEFEFPYLAHAPMEPVTAVARLFADRCEIWTGDGDVQGCQESAAGTLGLSPQQVIVHSVYAGGSFGRRGGTSIEAVEIARATGGAAPVKLIWTREDDIRGGGYRPMYLHRVSAGLDQEGGIIAWHHRIVGQSIFADMPAWLANGVDLVSVGGAANIPYDIPNILVELHSPKVGIPIRTWRGNPGNHTAFAIETMLDDIARETGRDPLELRRTLLARDPRQKEIRELAFPEFLREEAFAEHPRDLRVLELAAQRAGWGTPLPSGRGRGLALHYSFASSVAMVAEVTASSDDGFKVDRVVCAIDCGMAVNPDIVRAQMEGSIAWGLGAMLHSAITLDGGVVEQANFDDYQVLRIDEMPKVEVHIMPSSKQPTAAGEPGVPPIAPAVANALFAATGRRVRTLPFARA